LRTGVGGQEVGLVERDGLLAAATEPAQRLRAGEQQRGAIGQLAGTREEVVGVGELVPVIGGGAEGEHLAAERRGVLLLEQRRGDRRLSRLVDARTAP
jgi:hypothetical protein